MFRKQVGDQEYTIRFGHHVVRRLRTMRYDVHESTCWVYVGAPGQKVSEKTLLCSGSVKTRYPDVFIKATGRVYAMQKAIANLPRELRTALWDGYKDAMGTPRKEHSIVG